MDLPVISHPVIPIKIPSVGTKFDFRPFLVKEEKILLMAKESGDPKDILKAVKQIVTNCSLSNKLNIEKLSVVDLEYIFIKLRAASVDNIVLVSYMDVDDGKPYTFEINLEDIQYVAPKDLSNNIKINATTGLVMKPPPATLYDDDEFFKNSNEYLFELIIRCIESIYSGDKVYNAKEFTVDQLKLFAETLSLKTFNEVQKYLENSPKLEYVIQYTNDQGTDKKIVLNSLNDFFTFA